MSRLKPIRPDEMTDTAQRAYYDKIMSRENFKDIPAGAPLSGPFHAYQRSPDFATKMSDEAAIYTFTQTILTRHEVDDDSYQAALDTLGEAGLVELIGLIGSYSLTSMTLNTFKIPVRSGMARPYPDKQN